MNHPKNKWTPQMKVFLLVAATLCVPSIACIEDDPADVADPCDDGIVDCTSYEMLRVRHSGKCLHVMSMSMSDGAPVIQWSCQSSENQQVIAEPVDEGYLQFRFNQSDRCLEVEDASLSGGASAIQRECDGSPNQQFEVIPLEDHFMLQARHSEKCIGIHELDEEDGASTDQWECNGDLNQQFEFVSPESDPGSGGQCLSGGSNCLFSFECCSGYCSWLLGGCG